MSTSSFPTFERFLSWAQHEDAHSVGQLLSKEPQWAQERDPEGNTALICAAGWASVEHLRVLLPLSDAQALNKKGISALMLAAFSGKVECVQLLLDACEPQHRQQADQWRQTALLWAVSAQVSLECLELLLPGADLSLQDVRGHSALMLAAELPCPLIFERLLPLCSQETVRLRDKRGYDALMIAVEASALDQIKRLVPLSDLEAVSNTPQSAPCNALQLATQGLNVRIVGVLLPHCPESVCAR